MEDLSIQASQHWKLLCVSKLKPSYRQEKKEEKQIVKKKQNPEEVKPEIRQSSEFEKKEIIDTIELNKVALIETKKTKQLDDGIDPDEYFATETFTDIRKNKDIQKISAKYYAVIYLAGLVGDPITKKYMERKPKKYSKKILKQL